MQAARRSMRWFAAAMAVVYWGACGGGAADFARESGTGTWNAGGAYDFVENPDPGKPLLAKARLKAPRPVSNQQLGQATSITRDGSELLLSGQYVDGVNGSSAIFFGY